MKYAMFAILCSVLLISGCSRSPPCLSKPEHTWGKWTNEWNSPNDMGGMLQSRTCEECGLVEYESHY